ncbi:MAG: tetratricopeptide repeat protein [Alcanivoracaceae bacterium]
MRLVVLLLSVSLLQSVAAQTRIDRHHAVTDPGYGAVLFEYYQQHWFAAMTEAMLALETGTVPVQQTQTRILLGALYAHYGMPDEAERLFRELLDQAIDPALAPSIWLHLAELHYRQQRYQDALSLLDDRIGQPPVDLLRQFHALRTRILMRLGRFEETGTALEHLSENALSHYLRYNLAVSRINAGQGDAGVSLLWQVANLIPGDEQTNALKDRAMLALGVHYLRSGDGERARGLLRAMRAEGPYSETALLFHARAWLASDQPVRALGSLQVLSARSMQFEESQEAWLSLPWLYQLLGDDVRAAQGYRDAIARYTEHYRYLAGLEARVQSGEWFRELVQEPVWSTAMDALPPFQPAKVESFATFRGLFASHPFHSRWRDYHEHLRQLHLLQRWQQRLPAVEEMVAAQIRKHREQVPLAREFLAALDQAAWPQQWQHLDQRFRHGREHNDMAMFASDRERELLAALNEAEQLAERWPDRLRPEVRDRLALQKGLLIWQLQSDMVPRQWQRERDLRHLQPLLAEMALLMERVSEAAVGDSHRAMALGQQLAGLYNDLAALEQRGHALLRRQQQVMEAMALAQIATTRVRLKAFTAESWSGLGDLQNRILREQRQPALPSQGSNRSSE